MDNRWTRRAFLEATVAGSFSLYSFSDLVLGGNQDSVVALSSVNEETLKAAIDELIPAMDEMPSASQVGGIEYFTRLFEENESVKGVIEEGLTYLSKASQERHGNGFYELSKDKRIELLQELESDASSSFFSTLRRFTYEGYYTNPKVWQILDYEPHPTTSPGPQMKPFNATLLQRVQQIPAFYKEVAE